MSIIDNKNFCLGCERFLEPKDFYPNYNRFHKKKLMYYCKECCKAMSEEMFTMNANREVCIRNMCVMFDMPFYFDAMKLFEEEVNKGIQQRSINFVYKYLLSLKELNVPKEAWDDLSTATLYGVNILKVARPTAEGDVELLTSLENDWGQQESIYDYLWLEERFNELINGQDLTPAALTTVRYLCLTQMEIRKGKMKKEDTSKLEERYTKYLKSLKLDNFNISGDKPLIEKTLENWALIQETKTPIEWVGEHQEDICGFRDDYDEVMRCVGNRALGMKQYPNLDANDVKSKKSSKKSKGGGKNDN